MPKKVLKIDLSILEAGMVLLYHFWPNFLKISRCLLQVEKGEMFSLFG